MPDTTSPVIQLTIAIPTWNRADYLRLNLIQLAKELTTVPPGKIEIIISDNASTDATPSVVQEFINQNIPLRSIRNPENIGSDHNIAQCFNEAAGRYVLILGDDDLLVDGALAKTLNILEQGDYGVILLRPYGYDNDFLAERPRISGSILHFSTPGPFLIKSASLAGLISCNIIGKHILKDIDARQYCGTSLVQTYLIYEAALRAQNNIFCEEYLIAYKRNNWGFYPFVTVFVERFWTIVDYFYSQLGSGIAKQLAARMLLQYYPFYVWKQRLKSDSAGLQEDYQRFYDRFHTNIWFWIMIAPLYKLPRIPAIVWGAIVVTLGRAATGDARRGIYFAWNALRRKLRWQ